MYEVYTRVRGGNRQAFCQYQQSGGLYARGETVGPLILSSPVSVYTRMRGGVSAGRVRLLAVRERPKPFWAHLLIGKRQARVGVFPHVWRQPAQGVVNDGGDRDIPADTGGGGCLGLGLKTASGVFLAGVWPGYVPARARQAVESRADTFLP